MPSPTNDLHPSFDAYVAAIKREARCAAPADWVETLRKIQGVEIVSEGRGEAIRRVVTFNATVDGMREAVRQLGTFCHIESTIRHHPSSSCVEATLPPLPEQGRAGNPG